MKNIKKLLIPVFFLMSVVSSEAMRPGGALPGDTPPPITRGGALSTAAERLPTKPMAFQKINDFMGIIVEQKFDLGFALFITSAGTRMSFQFSGETRFSPDSAEHITVLKKAFVERVGGFLAIQRRNKELMAFIGGDVDSFIAMIKTLNPSIERLTPLSPKGE